MPTFPPSDLAAWTAGTWTRLPEREITAVVHDTRRMGPGALYVALAGEQFDGHAFLPVAPELGAVAAVCARGRSHPALPCLEVSDPLAALRDLAAGHRRRLGGLLIGVTGSAGKTTVKEPIAAMLAQRGGVCRTPGNWNNHIGLPLSLLAMEADDDFGVFELGMNQPGEIAPLAALLRPLCGLITSIGEAHIGAFGSLDGIAHEKAELLRALPPEGLAIHDIDSPWAPLFKDLTPCRIVSCSLRAKADFVGQPLDGGQDRMRVQDLRHGLDFDLTLPQPGSHMMRNVLLAVAVARESGLSPGEIAEGLLAFTACPMRWERFEWGGFRIINDAYNANPPSMRGAIKTFAALEGLPEKWVVLGGMAELGDLEASAHRELGAYLARHPWAGLLCVGPVARGIAAGFRDGQGRAAFLAEVPDVAEAARLLLENARPGAGILLKASRSDRLERVLSFIPPLVEGEQR